MIKIIQVLVSVCRTVAKGRKVPICAPMNFRLIHCDVIRFHDVAMDIRGDASLFAKSRRGHSVTEPVSNSYAMRMYDAADQ